MIPCYSPFKECQIFSTQCENIQKEFGGTWNHVNFCDAFVNAVNKLPVKYTGLGTCLSVWPLFTPDIQRQYDLKDIIDFVKLINPVSSVAHSSPSINLQMYK